MKFKDYRGCSVLNWRTTTIQDFILRWEQALLLTSDPPSDKVLEGLYVSKLQDSSEAQTIMALYTQEILRGGGWRDVQLQHEEHDQRILLKERSSPNHYGKKRGRISDIMSDHSLSS